ncbi:MAG: RES domain-containing protein [Opitutaceae bacterium]|jgi:hypothetical protein|nr:RES domain-containing protein [Opitutaceae bacterium]
MEQSKKYICCTCVKETYLSLLIRREGTQTVCSYCEEENQCIKISELADKIELAFEQHYQRTSTEPDSYEYTFMKESWEREGDEVLYVIADAAGIDENVANDILDILEKSHYDHHKAKVWEETPFARDAHYIPNSPDSGEYYRKWLTFETHLKNEARFFSRFTRDILNDLFENIETLKTKAGAPVIQTIGPDTALAHLYRARVFQSRDDVLKEALSYPWKGLGPPPSVAATAGRMNAHGISVFYGSTFPDTAIAEVRPPVGSRVAVAKFDIIRRLRLLDVLALQEIFTDGSIFDPDHLGQIQLSTFLRHLSRRITKLIMPDDEVFEYLPTQAIADYLASECMLDGIIFLSAQARDKDQLNVVLFHHASAVEIPELPEGTEIEVRLESLGEDSPSLDYRVWESVPTEIKAPNSKKEGRLMMLSPAFENDKWDARQPALRIDVKQIAVHHITMVKFTYDSYEIHRRRSTNSTTTSDF